MRSLYETIRDIHESNILKTRKIKNTRFVKCKAPREIDFADDIKFDTWNCTEFMYDQRNIVAYWTTEYPWIFYHDRGSDDWAAFAPAYIDKSDYTEDLLFRNFENMLMDGATIPEFDQFKTDLN